MDFFYPLPNQGTLGERLRRLPAVRAGDARIASAATSGSITRRARTTRCSSAGAISNRDPNSITFEAGNALTNLPILNTQLNTASVIGGWTKILSPTIVNEFRAGYNYDNSSAGKHVYRRGRDRPSSASRTRRASEPTGAGSLRSSSRPERTGPPTSPTPAGTWTARFGRTPSRSATTSRGSRERTR